MASIKDIYWWLLCLISFKGLESAKMYVVDIPNTEDDTALLNNYDEYDPVSEFVYDNRNRKHKIFKNVGPKKTKQDKTAANVIMCQKLFRSLFGHRNPNIRCQQALKTNKRSYDYAFLDKPKEKYKKHPLGYHSHVKKEKHYKPFIDLTRFSQDYLDVKDLGRSEAFASDYVDIDDFKSARALPDCNNLDFDVFDEFTKADCVPQSRKSALTIKDSNNNFFKRTKDAKFKAGPDETIKSVRRRAKPKRYKVISNDEDSESSDDSDDSDSDEDVPARDKNENVSETDNNSAGSDSGQNTEFSIEVKTKKHQSKSKKNREREDGYVLLQGNNYYNIDGSRRGMRLPHFLPKKFHWKEDDYQRLGYYWFNGSKGEYKN